MMIHEITEKVGKYKSRKRIGRGHGSGHGKTSGRGHKGAGSRAGASRKIGFEGGQMPWFRRVPKRGFSNVNFATNYQIVNLRALSGRFDAGTTIDAEALANAGLIRDAQEPVKILGIGEADSKWKIVADKVSNSARQKIEAAGGTIELIVKEKWTRPDRKKKADAPKAASSEA